MLLINSLTLADPSPTALARSRAALANVRMMVALSTQAQAREGQMRNQSLKDHPLDFEVAAALAAVVAARFYFGFGWLMSVLLGAATFVLIPLLVLCWFQVKALLYQRRRKRLRPRR